jgi:HSP20 family protein
MVEKRPDRKASRAPMRPGIESNLRRRILNPEDELDPMAARFLGKSRPDYPTDRFWQPIVDIMETESEMTVKAELPDVRAEELDISVVGDALRLKGRRKPESLKQGERCCHSERSFGYFDRSLRLPAEADNKKTKAKYKNGVLTITMPKKKGGSKRIKVEEG